MEQVKKKNFFKSLDKFEEKKKQESIRKVDGEKTEAEFKAYGVHCKKKVKTRGFSPAEERIIEKAKETREREKVEEKIEKVIPFLIGEE